MPEGPQLKMSATHHLRARLQRSTSFLRLTCHATSGIVRFPLHETSHSSALCHNALRHAVGLAASASSRLQSSSPKSHDAAMACPYRRRPASPPATAPRFLALLP